MSLQLVGVTHRFGADTVLDGVSLHARSGECYGLLGNNGAGKTTALRIALGLLKPSCGRVIVDGIDTAAGRVAAQARLGALAEFPGFHEGLTAERNLILHARVRGTTTAEAATRSVMLLDRVGLSAARDKPVRAFSQGMRRRLGLALGLIGRPRVFVLDEPLNGLDPEGIADVRALLTSLARDDGITVVVSSHQLAEVEGLCHRVGLLRAGRVILEDTLARLLADAGSFRLVTSTPAAALRVLGTLGLAAPARDGEAAGSSIATLRFSIATMAAGEVLRALVAAACDVTAFGPEPRTLEAVYLSAARGEAADGTVLAPVPRPEPLRAGDSTPPAALPPVPGALVRVGRVLRHEMSRARNWRTVAMLAVPSAVAAGALWLRHHQVHGDSEAIAAGQTFSATDVTAFEGVGRGLSRALPVLLLVAAGVASQSVAGDLARGTLRTLLLNPLRRLDLAVGKLAAVMVITLAGYALLACVATGVSGALFGFRDLNEVLPNGKTFPLLRADQVWPEFWKALRAPILPLMAYTAVGFAVGACVRQAATALGGALGLVALLDLARSIARPWHKEGWLPSAHLPSPLGDVSFMQGYLDLAAGASNASWHHAGTAVLAPTVWLVIAAFTAVAAISRRSVP